MHYKVILVAGLLASLSACIPSSSPPATLEAQPTRINTLPSPMPAATPTSLPEMAAGPFAWSGNQPPLFMAHYIPWYQAPPVSGQWGWHWTMNHFSPSKSEEGQWSNFASHYTPMIGLYDSSDPNVLEYQVQLMKLSGIDGVIVDWYGIENFWDYGIIHTNTARLLEVIRKAGLKFVVCYEDQTVRHMVENGHINEAEAISHGQEVMRFLQNNWFQDEAYLKENGQPVLMIFGPQYFKSSEDWNKIFLETNPKPLFISLDNLTPGVAESAYPWPPMWASVGGVLSHDILLNYLNDFYSKSQDWQYRVAGAFPGFHDIYKQANVGPGYGYLDDLDGQTFHFTLQEAINHNPHMIQLITWNDYGEGTIIEPTQEFAYRYLEMVQEAKQATSSTAFSYLPSDLHLPLELFQMRQKFASDPSATAELERASLAILSGDLQTARHILSAFR
jgi:hypothetical protein